MPHNPQLKLRIHNCPPHLRRQVHELLHVLTDLRLSEAQQVVFWDAFPGNEKKCQVFWKEILKFWHAGKSKRQALTVFLQSHWDSIKQPPPEISKEPSRGSIDWLRWFRRQPSEDRPLPTRATAWQWRFLYPFCFLYRLDKSFPQPLLFLVKSRSIVLDGPAHLQQWLPLIPKRGDVFKHICVGPLQHERQSWKSTNSPESSASRSNHYRRSKTVAQPKDARLGRGDGSTFVFFIFHSLLLY